MDNGTKGSYCLAAMRIILGFMLVWAFFDKLLGLGMETPAEAAIINGGSPTEYYLTELTYGPFAGIYNTLAGNCILDFLLMAGLLLVGVALILGIASKLSTLGMCVMMALMYTLELPPSDNPVVDYHIVYILAMLSIYFLGGFDTWGLQERWSELPLVRRFSLLR